MHLWLRGNSWTFQIRIPADLADRFGHTPVRVALGPLGAREARRRARALGGHAEVAFAVARMSGRGSRKAQDKELNADDREELLDRLTKAAAVLAGAYDNHEAALAELEAALSRRETVLSNRELALQRYEQEVREAHRALSENPGDSIRWRGHDRPALGAPNLMQKIFRRDLVFASEAAGGGGRGLPGKAECSTRAAGRGRR